MPIENFPTVTMLFQVAHFSRAYY